MVNYCEYWNNNFCFFSLQHPWWFLWKSLKKLCPKIFRVFRRFSDVFTDLPILLSEFLDFLLNTYVIVFTNWEKIQFLVWKTLILSNNANSGNFRNNQSYLRQCAYCLIYTLNRIFQRKYDFFSKRYWFSRITKICGISEIKVIFQLKRNQIVYNVFIK